MKHRITAALERFSRAMLAPLSYLSAAGLLLVVGAYFPLEIRSALSD